MISSSLAIILFPIALTIIAVIYSFLLKGVKRVLKKGDPNHNKTTISDVKPNKVRRIASKDEVKIQHEKDSNI
jgi:hypothetical protein